MYLVILFFNNQFLVLSIIFRNFNRCLLDMMKEEGFNVSYDLTIFMWTTCRRKRLLKDQS